MATKATVETVDEVVVWRYGQLVEAGFSPLGASHVANDARFDIHALIQLVERGCPPVLATRILAPL